MSFDVSTDAPHIRLLPGAQKGTQIKVRAKLYLF